MGWLRGVKSFLSRHVTLFFIISAFLFLFGSMSPSDTSKGAFSDELRIAQYALWTAIVSMIAAIIGLICSIIDLFKKRRD